MQFYCIFIIQWLNLTVLHHGHFNNTSRIETVTYMEDLMTVIHLRYLFLQTFLLNYVGGHAGCLLGPVDGAHWSVK